MYKIYVLNIRVYIHIYVCILQKKLTISANRRGWRSRRYCCCYCINNKCVTNRMIFIGVAYQNDHARAPRRFARLSYFIFISTLILYLYLLLNGIILTMAAYSITDLLDYTKIIYCDITDRGTSSFEVSQEISKTIPRFVANVCWLYYLFNRFVYPLFKNYAKKSVKKRMRKIRHRLRNENTGYVSYRAPYYIIFL